MNRINLLPDHFIAHQRRNRLVMRVVIAAVFTVIAGTAWGAVARAQLGRLAEQVAVSQKRLAQEQQKTREIANRASEGRTLKAMLTHRGQIESPVAPGGVLALLTHLLPESVALTKVTMDVPAPDMTFRGAPAANGAPLPPAPGPQMTRIMLEGLALSDVELAKVVGSLAAQKAFTNVKLMRSRQVPLADQVRFGFEISLEVPRTVAVKADAAQRANAPQPQEKGERGA